ncbi:xanthine dehydrogenase family protein subunit M [Massilia sp. PAMC28688]|uniref:FAD binding domain-containing protein n=1 Tax=Massilia sp. PAMC28688 TaxID=2861283 RepID=UPI001C6379CE|nr:xanthine dehydrogenase family protein subunit M [Massilia sp. PAMC28688]QYF94283.1 xanthine dehydrogenase family protein subunit M [Massilia sp. PAMC28688]
MNPFSWQACDSVDAATGALNEHTKAVAGGTNLLDLMKAGVMRPPALAHVAGLPLAAIEDDGAGGLRLGATAHNADTAYHLLVRERYPLLTAAILAGASPQIRNMATNGGNLLQRTRCHYFYDTAVACNKRSPGSGCAAIGGLTRYHAILGASEHCIATHPSDMCVALAALDAVVHVRSVRGARAIAFQDFHRLPGDHPEQDSTLAADELITHIALPDASRFVNNSVYLKFRDRASYAFALVSAAAALDVGADGIVRDARVALGGVAHKPWRMRAAELALIGETATLPNFEKVADLLLAGAVPQRDNAFKLSMARRAVVRALEQALNGTIDNTDAGEQHE